MATKKQRILLRKFIRFEPYIYWQFEDDSQVLASLGKEIEVLPIIEFVLSQNPLWKTCANRLFPMVNRNNLGIFFQQTKKDIRKIIKNYISRYEIVK